MCYFNVFLSWVRWFESFIWLFLNTLWEADNQILYWQTKIKQCWMHSQLCFQNSRHRLFLWHTSKNAKQDLISIYAKANICGKCYMYLNIWMLMNLSTFREKWFGHISLRQYTVNRLYELREKWFPDFRVVIFSLSMKST